MKKAIVHSVFACAGCSAFFFAGIWLALGEAKGHTSLFSRAGGVAMAALFLWVASKYILQLRRESAD